MKLSLMVFAALMVGMAHAQSFDWNRAWAGCSAESSAFDAEARTNAPDQSSRKVKAYVEEVTGTPPTAAKLRAKMEEDRGVLSNSKAWAYLIQLSSKLALCGSTAALNQLQSGSTQSGATVSFRPSQGNASASSSSRDRADLAAHHCVSRVDNRLRNNCSQTIKVNWCTDDGGTFSSCGTKNIPFSIFNPGDSIYVSASNAYWFACATPARPSEVEYLPGQGLRGACSE